jgi:cyclopropane fatty-acyl-phospholipid synthase-like methyltransferase
MSFLSDKPDMYLPDYIAKLTPGCVLDLGCGEGRNALYMAEQGCRVDAVDLSKRAISAAKCKAANRKLDIQFTDANILEHDFQGKKYDFVYDSGLLHHLPPHRRFQYVKLLAGLLAPEGTLGLVCFASGFSHLGGPIEKSDIDVYKDQGMQGGMAYSKEKLIQVMSSRFEPLSMEFMQECPESVDVFGKGYLWSTLWIKK